MPGSHFKTFKEAVQASGLMVSILFIVEFAELVLQHARHTTLAGFGIVPRTVPGLVGIAFSPLLHASPAHLLANALPLFVLVTLLFWDRHYYPVVTLAVRTELALSPKSADCPNGCMTLIRSVCHASGFLGVAH